MNEELDKLMNAINHVNSTFLAYETIFNGFKSGDRVELGEGVWAESVFGCDQYLIIRLFVPKGSIVKVFHHDFKEETKVIFGSIRETVKNVTYESFRKITIPKEIPHGFLGVEDCLSYSKLYNPIYEHAK